MCEFSSRKRCKAQSSLLPSPTSSCLWSCHPNKAATLLSILLFSPSSSPTFLSCADVSQTIVRQVSVNAAFFFFCCCCCCCFSPTQPRQQHMCRPQVSGREDVDRNTSRSTQGFRGVHPGPQRQKEKTWGGLLGKQLSCLEVWGSLEVRFHHLVTYQKLASMWALGPR